MAKARIGFDIGNNSMKIAVAKRDNIRIHEVRIPENLMENGGIVMPNAFVDLLKKTRKELHLPKGDAALVLPSSQVICRMLTMPLMTEEQLLMNLPYEFSDFIHGDTEQYFCDYAICENPSSQEEGKNEEMTMMAAAVSKQQVYQYIRMFSQAGIRLKQLLPQEMALISLIKAYGLPEKDRLREYCFIDLGHLTTRITVVHGDRIQAMRQITLGGRNLDLAIGDQLGVDAFLANSYKAANYQNVLDSPACMDICSQIAVEILKVINFYQFTYRGSMLPGVYLAGGGARIQPLRQAIANALELPLLSPEELLPDPEESQPDCQSGIFAVGMALAQKGE